MEGRLKQKLQGEDGVLCWRRRSFVLGFDTLEISDDGCGEMTSVTHVSLEGARHAVAWSGINAFNGCGFDLVWTSGRTWSLLCEDPVSRKSWVEAFNLSIRQAQGEIDKVRFASHSRVTAGRQSVPPSNTVMRKGYRHHHRPIGQHPDQTAPAVAAPPSSVTSKGARGAAPGGRDHRESWPHEELMPRRGEPFARAFGFASAEGGRGGGRGHQHQRQQQQQQQQQRTWREPRPRRQRLEGSASAAEHDRYYSPCISEAENGALSPTGGASVRRGDGEDVRTVRGTPVSIDGSECLGGGSGGAGRTSRTRERGEELARASAATWEQFQRLLERSRESKARFDKVMNGAAVANTNIRNATAVSASLSSEVHGRMDSDNGEVASVFGRGPAGGQRRVSKAKGVPLAAVAAGGAPQDGTTLATSAEGSSTDRTSGVTTPRSCVGGIVGDSGCSEGEGRGRAASTIASTVSRASQNALDDFSYDVGYFAASSGAVADVDATITTEREHSRFSAGVTDGETSLFLEEGSAENSAKGRIRSTAKASSSSSRGSGSPEVVGVRGEIATRGEAAATATAIDERVQQLEADLATARRKAMTAAAAAKAKAEAEAEAKNSLQRGFRAALNPGGDGRGGSENDSENQRLTKELAALRAAGSENHDQQRKREAESSRALVEMEGDRNAMAAASAAAAAVVASTQGQGEARLEEALAKAAKAEKERAEVVRQREELEKALAAEIGERRRVSDLLEACTRSERALRERVDSAVAEGDLKARLASARSELEAVSLERDTLAEELDRCIRRLGDQAREVASALRSRQQREIAEISSRCEIEKEALRERLALEAEEKATEATKLAVSAQEKRIRGELAAEVAKEVRRRDKLLRQAKAEAESAGEATRKDIDKLRGLHAKRVKRLEALLKEESENLAEARREIAACKATMAGDAGDFQRWTEEERNQSTKLLKELAAIQKKVDRAVATEAEARERERLAMNRVRKVMEEARLERAEGAAVKRQLREALAELESDRIAQARRARNNLQLKRAAEIAQQEVAMVEAERVRWHEERRSMEAALERLTRLVYGPATANANDGHNNIATEKNVGKNTPACPWKPPGGVMPASGRVHGGGGGNGGSNTNARAACSPIGVNAFRGSTSVRGCESTKTTRVMGSGAQGGIRTTTNQRTG